MIRAKHEYCTCKKIDHGPREGRSERIMFPWHTVDANPTNLKVEDIFISLVPFF